ncbi:MAG: metal ABC transporter permease [Dehalococcoidia bacterium]|nr:metal ABC transporter permease [Dehalococcoidia bacterium]
MMEALQYDFMRNALAAGVLASVACGIVGVYVVVKRIVFISGGIAHASFGGIGLGYFLGINPVLGALFFAVASALGMGLVSRRTRLPEDTAIGVFWVVGMALGILFVGLTPGYAPGLFTYLFGNILTVPGADLIIMLFLNVIIIVVVLSLYKEFLAISFDEEFSTVVGIPTERLYLLLLCLVALTVVVLIRVVGVILVIALLTIPAAAAKQFTYNLGKMMFLSVLFGIISVLCGLCLSYELDLASGATIVLFSVVLFLISFGFKRLCNRKQGLSLPPQ